MADYIPGTEGEIADFVSNFVTVATANATPLGLSAAQTSNLSTLSNDWSDAREAKIAAKSAYDGAVAAQNSAQTELIALIRDLVGLIQKSPGITDDLRRQLRITVPKDTRSVIGAPTTFPILSVDTGAPMQHILGFADSDTPRSRAKPAGVAGCQVYELVLPTGSPAPTDRDSFNFVALDTRTPYLVAHHDADLGKTAYYVGRWQNEKGETGPWGQIVSHTIAG